MPEEEATVRITPTQYKKLQAIMDKAPAKTEEPVIFAEVESKGKLIRVFRDVYKNRELLQIRKFWREDDESEWKPGKGCTFDFEVIDDIIDGLHKMQDWCGEHQENGKEVPGRED